MTSPGTVAVLDVGGMDYQDTDQQAGGIGHDMTLATVDLLAGIVTPGARRFRSS